MPAKLTRVRHRRKQQGLHRESTSFSLVYRADDGGERTLDLVCKVRVLASGAPVCVPVQC